MLLYCIRMGTYAVSFDGTPRMLKRLVSQGYPIIVLQDDNLTQRLGHYRIVVGYNDSKGVFVLRDNTNPHLIKISYRRFNSLWDPHGDWALLVCPTGRSDYRSIVDPSNTVVHIDLATAYMHRGERTLAEVECLKALVLEPNNNFTRKLLTRIRRQRVSQPSQGA